jgi:O-antigen ligase
MQNIKFGSVIFTLLCIVLLWAPIPVGSNRPWAWSLLELLIGMIFLLHLANASRANGPQLWQRWFNPLFIPIVLLQFYLWLQMSGIIPLLQSVDPKQTQIMLIKGLFFLMWLQLVCIYTNSALRLRMFVLMMVLSGFVQAFYGSVLNLAEVANSPLFAVNEAGRARGSFVYQNHFANYLAMCLAMALGLLLSELSSQPPQWRLKVMLRDFFTSLLSSKLMLRLAIIVMVIGLVLSRSRMGNAAFFTSLALVSFLALFFYKRPPALLKPLVISILLLDMLIIGSMFGLEKLQQRFAETSFASEARDEVVIDSLPILQQFGWQGTGGGTFYTVFPAYQPQMYSGFYDHAHNDYLQFAIEVGIPMTLLLGLMLLWSLWQNVQVMRQSDHKLHRGLAFGCAMATVHMLIHCTVDFNLQAPATAMLYLTILAIGQRLYSQRLDKVRRSD